ncbi:phage tail length tape measure family protein [Desulfovibrio oxyclinae]|uniref:phage tail length tape measure family protein n=1 Tax=Desulfovibrio oxyclinae TaxID=63560 RepID=UPI000365A107|nr:phage tail length tape measure family protein [Desulfovibrio oxyclinae]
MANDSSVRVLIEAVNKTQDEFREVRRDLKRTERSTRKAETAWDRFGRGVKRGAGDAEKAVGRFTDRLGPLGSVLGSFGAAGLGAAAGLAAVAVAAVKGTMSAADWGRRMNRTEALIRSTGAAAGFTAAELDKLARERDLATLGDRNEIMDAINMLQTFKSVQGDTFKQALTLSQDMSETMGQSLKTSITQVGKALEDPVRGLTALRRSGVSFTAAEEDMIKSMVEANDIIGAQEKILEALEGQFSGAAEAAAVGLPGALDTLSYEWREFLESMEQTDAATGFIKDLTRQVRYMREEIQMLNGTLDPEVNVSKLRTQIQQQKNMIKTAKEQGQSEWSLEIGGVTVAQTELSEAQSRLAELEEQLNRAVRAARDRQTEDRIRSGAYLPDRYGDKDSPRKDTDNGPDGPSIPETWWADDYANGVKERQRVFAKALEDQKTALKDFDRDYREITMGETQFAIAEVQARSEQLQRYARGDAEEVAEIQHWENLRIAEINEEAAGKSANAWEQYADGAMDSMRNMSSLANTVGSTMEDAFVSAFTGAEVSAEKMFQTIYAEMVRVSIARPMAGAMTEGLGSIFGAIFHDGGAVGGPAPVRAVPADLFAHAPRYHGGGRLGPGERPVIARDGEIILNAAQQDNVANQLGRDGAPVNVRVINNGRGEVRTQQHQRADGGMDLDIIFDEIDRLSAQGIRGGQTRTAEAIEDIYGADRGIRRY